MFIYVQVRQYLFTYYIHIYFYIHILKLNMIYTVYRYFKYTCIHQHIQHAFSIQFKLSLFWGEMFLFLCRFSRCCWPSQRVRCLYGGSQHRSVRSRWDGDTGCVAEYCFEYILLRSGIGVGNWRLVDFCISKKVFVFFVNECFFSGEQWNKNGLF